MQTINEDDLAHVSGGAGLDPNRPLQLRDRVLQQCAPQLDAFTQARQQVAQHPGDARAELNAAAAGRSLALCSTNAGFDPPQSWRYPTSGGGR
jgi:bacteriocin-like protein